MIFGQLFSGTTTSQTEEVAFKMQLFPLEDRYLSLETITIFYFHKMFYLISFLRTSLPIVLFYIAAIVIFVELFNPSSPVGGILLFLSSCVPIKPKRIWLSQAERQQFSLTQKEKEIAVGLILGDVSAQKQNVNVRLSFSQGLVHEEYLDHLYNLFRSFCNMVPKTSTRAPDKRTGVSYGYKRFNTLSLPCFNEFYELFYVEGKKVVPQNIFDLLTPLGLAYWLADDGTFDKGNRSVRLCTHSFSLEEVNLLINVLENKWNLKCTVNNQSGQFVIRIWTRSLPLLQSLLGPHMPPMMQYKIGL